MHWIRRKHAYGNSTRLDVLVRVALFLFAAAVSVRAQGQTSPIITNLLQLSQLVAHEPQVIADAQLPATVFACDTNAGVLIVQDATGAELLELDGLKTNFQAGDQIEITGRQLLFSSSEAGIYISAAPAVNNDGVHVPRTLSGQRFLTAGRHAVRVDWFNQALGEELELGCAEIGGLHPSGAADATNLFHAVSAACFQGDWFKLPNFQLLKPVKSGVVSNFDISYRTRDESVGIRFEGYLEVPADGHYQFSLRSDDGSRLWIDSPEVPILKTGTASPPVAPQAELNQPETNKTGRRLATIQGRVGFATRFGKGLRLELDSGQGRASVYLADAGAWEPSELLSATVRVSGLAGDVLTMNQLAVLGTLAAADPGELTIVELPPGRDKTDPPLRTVVRIHNLTSNEVAQGLPVEIRGVVTAVAEGSGDWIIIQDSTRGTFVGLGSSTERRPAVGELWSIAGRTKRGGFAPEISAEKSVFLGKGQLPEPAHPTWSQLANGSLDVQWVELEGIVTGVRGNKVRLLLPEGNQTVSMSGWGESELKPMENALVRIRGVLFATWEGRTHEAIVGSCGMVDASISVENPAPSDPFDAPEKSPAGLFRFDARATPLQRVKVQGQVAYADAKRVILEKDAGIEVFPTTQMLLRAGDRVEAVGYPVLFDTGPQLREALLRKTADGSLPEAPFVPEKTPLSHKFDLARVRIEGTLADLHTDADALVMQILTHSNLVTARVANGGPPDGLRLGSKLLLTAVVVSSVRPGAPSTDPSRFELLLNSPADVAVLSMPSWWTLQRLLTLVSILVVILVLAFVWIGVLRRQVAQRSRRLQHEVQEREQAERQRAVESERSRIARDLHDELGAGLTEMSLLASAGIGETQPEVQTGERLQKIADRARGLVSGLDIIVWAIDPERNSLQAFADYVEFYTEELLSASNIRCRFKIPVECRPATLSGATRHSLLLAVKEALTNVIRHSAATEVELQIEQPGNDLEITITDNGRGFDPSGSQQGDGLRNLRQRMEAMGGKCQIEPILGQGTSVRLVAPLEEAKLSTISP